MGVPGLVTFCRRNNCYKEFDLVTLAKEMDLEILIDFYGMELHIMELALKGLAHRYHNEYLTLPGGHYDHLITAFRDFHQMFTNIGVKVVYICDGPKGLDMCNQQHKEKSWDFRFQKNLRTLENYLSYCKNPQSSSQIIREIIVRPSLMIDLFKQVIQEEGGEIVSLIFGEADHQIANLRRERGSWAVLTNDSDFFIFHQCPTIQIGFFDLDRDLGMGRGWTENTEGEFCTLKPKRLTVGLINDEVLLSFFHLTSHSQLIDYAILMGNDYTIDFAPQLRDYCQIKWKYDYSEIPDSMKVAEWVRNQKDPLISSEVFQQFSATNPEYKKSIQFSIDFYNQSLPVPVLSFTSVENEKLWNYLEIKYKLGELPNLFLLAFHGFVYQKNCVEPMKPNDIHTLLNDLRSNIYSLCLQHGMTTVSEYQVPNVDNNTRVLEVPPSNIKLNTHIEYPFKYFEIHWSAFDVKKNQSFAENSLRYFHHFGTEVGFCCYCLRTLWNFTTHDRTKESALILTENDLRAVFCAVFFVLLQNLAFRSLRYENMWKSITKQYPNSWFYLLKICPSSSCETAQEWLQVIYNVAYNHYAKGLNITKHFPKVTEFISGSIFIAFFEYVHNRGQRLRHLESSKINEIYDIMDTIFNEFGGVFNAILEPF